MKYLCPVCRYGGLYEAPYDEAGTGSDGICPCCGFHFGYDDYPDKQRQIEAWRKSWLEKGAPWFSKHRKAPEGWDGKKQFSAPQSGPCRRAFEEE